MITIFEEVLTKAGFDALDDTDIDYIVDKLRKLGGVDENDDLIGKLKLTIQWSKE